MIFNTLGGLLRWATLFHDGSGSCESEFCPAPKWSYNLALTGTAVIAIGQPFFLVTPTKLAAQWFRTDQRLLANSIASLSNPLGQDFGNLTLYNPL